MRGALRWGRWTLAALLATAPCVAVVYACSPFSGASDEPDAGAAGGAADARADAFVADAGPTGDACALRALVDWPLDAAPPPPATGVFSAPDAASLTSTFKGEWQLYLGSSKEGVAYYQTVLPAAAHLDLTFYLDVNKLDSDAIELGCGIALGLTGVDATLFILERRGVGPISTPIRRRSSTRRLRAARKSRSTPTSTTRWR